jgi:hypothetical protein
VVLLGDGEWEYQLSRQVRLGEIKPTQALELLERLLKNFATEVFRYLAARGSNIRRFVQEDIHIDLTDQRQFWYERGTEINHKSEETIVAVPLPREITREESISNLLDTSRYIGYDEGVYRSVNDRWPGSELPHICFEVLLNLVKGRRNLIER